jgi:hypothetical protein
MRKPTVKKKPKFTDLFRYRFGYMTSKNTDVTRTFARVGRELAGSTIKSVPDNEIRRDKDGGTLSGPASP